MLVPTVRGCTESAYRHWCRVVFCIPEKLYFMGWTSTYHIRSDLTQTETQIIAMPLGLPGPVSRPHRKVNPERSMPLSVIIYWKFDAHSCLECGLTRSKPGLRAQGSSSRGTGPEGVGASAVEPRGKFQSGRVHGFRIDEPSHPRRLDTNVGFATLPSLPLMRSSPPASEVEGREAHGRYNLCAYFH